jgi:hypothetical protein
MQLLGDNQEVAQSPQIEMLEMIEIHCQRPASGKGPDGPANPAFKTNRNAQQRSRFLAGMVHAGFWPRQLQKRAFSDLQLFDGMYLVRSRLDSISTVIDKRPGWAACRNVVPVAGDLRRFLDRIYGCRGQKDLRSCLRNQDAPCVYPQVRRAAGDEAIDVVGPGNKERDLSSSSVARSYKSDKRIPGAPRDGCSFPHCVLTLRKIHN